jgi:thioredoxin-like negative regulator of GroEL
VLALLAALCAVVGVGIVSFDRTREQLAVLEACEQVREGHFERALALSEARVGTDETGRAAAECRCNALAATGRTEDCFALLEALLADPAVGDWVPAPEWTTRLIQRWREAGRSAEAAALARRAGRAHPLDAGVFHLELTTRSGVESEEAVLRELERRIPTRGDAATRMRVSLAQRYLQRGDAGRALEVLGAEPAAGTSEALGLWFDTRAVAYAMAGDAQRAREVYAAWEGAGGDPAEVRARYALALSIAGLADPRRSPVDLLREALATTVGRDEPELREALVIRLILTLANVEEFDAALATYDRYREEFALEGLHRAELERASRTRAIEELQPEARRGWFDFQVVGAPPGSALAVSPETDAPPDADYESFALPASGALRVERAAGEAPQRWVLRGADGSPLASGTANPFPGRTLEVLVRVGAPRPGERPPTLVRRPADGRRRVALILLDCADWRIAQYLRARGELPVLDALLAVGFRAVIDSDPPLTGAALEALVWPSRRGDASFLGLMHQLGTEAAGLASIGDNPFDWLTWVLPESADLFTAIGAGERSAANLLLAHGGIRAGRHGVVSGPRGARRRLALGSTARDLDAAERARWPELVGLSSERDSFYVQTIAAELDAATELVRDGAIDLIALRVEPLDILTHAHFAEISADGQDDGRGLLFAVYRYIDARLETLHNALDADDVLVVMSDHGIRTAMQHSRDAIFVAAGAGVPHGRAAGRPALRGVSRAVADLLAVETDWPDTGVAPWAAALARAADDTATP